MMRHVSFRLRVVVSLLLLSLIPMVLMGVQAANLASRTIRENALQQTQADLDRQVNSLQVMLNSIAGDVLVISATPPIQGIVRARDNGGIDPLDNSTYQEWVARLEDIFAAYATNESTYVQLRYLDASGQELVRVNQNGSVIERVPADELQNKVDRYYVADTLAMQPGQVYFSPMDLNRENGELQVPYTPVLRVGTPVLDSDGVLRGAIIINVLGRELLENLAEGSKGVNLYLVNQDGFFLRNPKKPDVEFAFDLGGGYLAMEDFPVPLAQAAETGSYEGVDEDSARVIGVEKVDFSPGHPEWYWMVVAAIPTKEAFASVTTLVGGITGSAAIAVLLIGIIAWAIAQSILRPVLALTRSAQQVANGDLSVRTQVAGTDEVSVLAETFNAMLDTLQRSRQELQENVKKLEATNRDLQEFAYVASHDLQEPLRKVQAFGDRLYDKYKDELGDQGRTYLDIMKDASSRMQVLINDLLAFSRLNTRAMDFESVNLGQVMQDILSDLSELMQHNQAQVKVGPLPTLFADPSQMYHLLLNLVANGLKFHKQGQPPKLEISSKDADGFYEIRVHDDGIGFDLQYLDRIFKPFQRLHSKEEFAGSGIGLAICRRIVERHNGAITAESAEGQGATFIVKLPKRIQEESQE